MNIWGIKSLKAQHLFEIEIVSDIINVFTVTFDQFIASLLIKSMHFFKINLTDPKLLNSSRLKCFDYIIHPVI